MYSIGKYVKLKNSTLVGKILDIKTKNNTTFYKLKINNKTTTINEAEILSEINYNYNDNNNDNSKVNIITNNSTFNNELMIRHLTKDEALVEIERFIDKALINNVKIIKIVHGKSGGILRKLTHDYLKENEFVKSFRLGYPHEGSYGVTIVLLK